MDFLILFEEFKLIISIECKSSSKQIIKAVKQFYQIQQLLQKILSFEEDGWQLVRISYFSNIDPLGIKVHCEECRKFCVTGLDSIEQLIISIINNCKVAKGGNDFISHISRLTFLYFVQYPQQYPCNLDTEIKANLDEAGSAENIIFWTKTQMALLESKTDKNTLKDWEMSQNRVLFENDFGTGKTIVLRHKALKLAQDYPTLSVYFITLPVSALIDKDQLLIYLEAKKFFHNVTNIKVLTWQDIEILTGMNGNHDFRVNILKTFIEKTENLAAGYFFDEMSDDIILNCQSANWSIETIGTLILELAPDFIGLFTPDNINKYSKLFSQIFQILNKHFQANAEEILDVYPESEEFITEIELMKDNNHIDLEEVQKFFIIFSDFLLGFGNLPKEAKTRFKCLIVNDSLKLTFERLLQEEFNYASGKSGFEISFRYLISNFGLSSNEDILIKFLTFRWDMIAAKNSAKRLDIEMMASNLDQLAIMVDPNKLLWIAMTHLDQRWLKLCVRNYFRAPLKINLRNVEEIVTFSQYQSKVKRDPKFNLVQSGHVPLNTCVKVTLNDFDKDLALIIDSFKKTLQGAS